MIFRFLKFDLFAKILGREQGILINPIHSFFRKAIRKISYLQLLLYPFNTTTSALDYFLNQHIDSCNLLRVTYLFSGFRSNTYVNQNLLIIQLAQQ